MSWKSNAAAVDWNIRPFIDGRFRASASGESIANINPATETELCRIPVGSPVDVDEAVRMSRRRFNDGCWSQLPPARRTEILFRLADLLVAHKAELALLDCLEMGKPIQAALYDVEHLAALYLRTWASFADKLVGSCAPLNAGAMSFNTYEPRGVVGAITAWNFPLLNAVYKIGPALAAGNTVVLKPSELTPSSALRLAELAVEAGVPAGVLNVVPGTGSTVGAALGLHPDVDLLSFTGSTVTGRRIMELSAHSNGKPLLLECGGKSPHVVFHDLENFDAAADTSVQAILWNQGQVCGALTRLIAHEDIKEVVLEKIVARASKCRPGDPLEVQTTFGPLASPAQRDRVAEYIRRGVRDGAEAVLAGDICETGGCYVSPTIFDRVDSGMAIAREEIFGPVLCVQGFKTEEEAVMLANSTDYGLVAMVSTRDLGRATRMARAIRAGAVIVSTSGQEGPESGCMLSWEPQKASGFGSEVGLKGLQSYSTLKFVNIGGP